MRARSIPDEEGGENKLRTSTCHGEPCTKHYAPLNTDVDICLFTVYVGRGPYFVQRKMHGPGLAFEPESKGAKRKRAFSASRVDDR